MSNYFLDGIGHHAKVASDFYAGIARIIEGDDDQDAGLEFLGEVFANSADESTGEMDVGFIEFYALGTLAGLYRDLEDAKEIHKRQSALFSLVRRAAKFTAEQIDEIVPDDEIRAIQRRRELEQPPQRPVQLVAVERSAKP